MTRRKRLWLAGAALLIFVGASLTLCARPVAWSLLRQTLRGKFPQVQRISTTELAAWLRDQRQPPPVLLDARTPAEYAASHLPGARRVDFNQPAAAQISDLPKSAPLVVYCSVGYRSSLFAEQLTRAGFADVRNLEGSIFQWANEDRPLADGKQRVHPYNPRWGLLLKPQRRLNEKADASARDGSAL